MKWEWAVREEEGLTASNGWSRPVGLVGLRHTAGAMGTVRAAGELQDHGAIGEAIEKHHRQRGGAKSLAPYGEVDVRRQGR